MIYKGKEGEINKWIMILYVHIYMLQLFALDVRCVSKRESLDLSAPLA